MCHGKEEEKMKKKLRNVICTVICIVCILASLPLSYAAGNVPTGAGTVNTAGGRLNVRSAPSMSAAVVGSLYKGAYVTLYESVNGFVKLGYSDGKTGYCSERYIAKISGSYAASVNITSGYLNVRSGGSTAYSVIARLYRGDTVVVVSTSSGWAKIVFGGGRTGYVSSAYIRRISSAANGVSLNVPSFKQTDSRWKNVTLGSSGKTIGAIGCTTTCLAMTESFRTGTVIYPDRMAGRLSYSSGGSLYWPSNYVTDISSASWLYRVKTLLNSGKPVILGCKNYSGSMHWVVITGYTGGGNAVSDFSINDPGSAYRTKLSDFTALYPVFYKLAYYTN